jgi:hypothetical protein
MGQAATTDPRCQPRNASGTSLRRWQGMARRPEVRSPTLVALAVAAPLAVLYLVLAPPAADLAAASYRSDLFARAGFVTWDTGWYAAHGHWLPAYSLLSPPLGALLGVRVLLALSALTASALFGAIADRCFGTRAGRVSAAVFALGVSVGLLSGRVPFGLGLAIGLAATLALLNGRLWPAVALAGLTSVASPVAGAFLALAGLAHATAVARRGLALAIAALAPALALSVAYPEGGYEPFAASAFWPALAGVALFAVLAPQGPLSARRHRVLRAGAALYALALAGAFAIHTPMGGNATRLGPLLAAPLVAGLTWRSPSGRLALLALAPALLYWQLVTPIRDYLQIAGDPSVHAAYYAPLRGELRRLRHGAATIVEVPLTRSHWEAAFLPGHDGVALARGWERQLDTRYGALFYGSRLSARVYRRWLAQNRVAYVALPDAPLDRAGRLEGALVAAGQPYLREIWASEHWRMYRFIG